VAPWAHHTTSSTSATEVFRYALIGKGFNFSIKAAGVMRPGQTSRPHGYNGQKLIDWNTKNSPTTKLSNTYRRLARDFIAQIGVARPLSEQFPKEMLLISERH
jgi:hypothetical protein